MKAGKIIKWLFTIGIFIFLLVLLGLKYYQDSKVQFLNVDEVFNIKKAPYLEMYLHGDWRNTAWKNWQAYDQPMLANYVYGLSFADLANGNGGYRSYLGKQGFYDDGKAICETNPKAGNYGEWWWCNNEKPLTNIASAYSGAYQIILRTRLVGVILIVLTVLVIFGTGWLMGGRLMGMAAAAWFGLNPLVVFSASQAMIDNLFLFLTTVQFGVLAVWYRFPRYRGMMIAALGAVSGFLAATKLNGFLGLGFVCLVLIVQLAIRERRTKLAAIDGAIVILMALAVFTMLNPFLWPDWFGGMKQMFGWRMEVGRNQQLASPMSAVNGVADALKFMALNLGWDWDGFAKTIGITLNLPMFLGGLVLLGMAQLKRLKKKTQPNDSGLMLLGYVIYMVISLLAYIPMKWARYLLPVFPAMAWIIGYLAAWLGLHTRRLWNRIQKSNLGRGQAEAGIKVLTNMAPRVNLKKEGVGLLMIVIFVMTLLTHGINIWRYPYFESDEGTYTSQAWWLVGFRQLGPYHYWYDHSPIGWFQIGVWQWLTGGPFAFGFSIYSTRIFMLVVAGISAILVFEVARRLAKSGVIAFFSTMIFTFSPLAIYFHRRVLLDNLETLWLLASMYLVVSSESHLWYMALSGALFGWSFLSKESAIFMLPAMVYFVWLGCRKENRLFGILLWVTSAVFTMLTYPFSAFFKGEFFPSGWFGDSTQHVSLLSGLFYQSNRLIDSSSGLWNKFWDTWWLKDPVVCLIMVWIVTIGAIVSFRDKLTRSVYLIFASYLVYLMASRVVFDFYVIPLLAITVILLSRILVWLRDRVEWTTQAPIFVSITISLIFGGMMLFPQVKNLFFTDETSSIVKSVEYVKKTLDPKSTVVTDDSVLIDMRLANQMGPAFPNAQWYSKVDNDEEIKIGALGNRWENISYLLLGSEMLKNVAIGGTGLLNKAYASAKISADFGPTSVNTYRDMGKGISTNGDWATLMAVEVPLSDQGQDRSFEGLVNFGDINQRIDRQISAMSLEDKVGQMFFISISGVRLENLSQKLIEEFKPGGILLGGENIIDEDSLIKLTNEVASATATLGLAAPIFSVDQEGGNVSRIPFENYSAQYPSEIKSAKEAYDIAFSRGRQLRQWGIGIDFAPVADVSYSDNSSIGREKRSFPGDNVNVGDFTAQAVKAYSDSGILPVVKHFPGGLGRTSVDPHQTMPEINISASDVENDLVPFRKAIDAGAGGIMVTHTIYPTIDAKYPASMSREFISKLLREQLGFGGVVFIDDISMSALENRYKIEEVLANSVNAGGDELIMTGNSLELDSAKVTLVDLVKSGRIPQSRIDQAVKRILTFKAGFLN